MNAEVAAANQPAPDAAADVRLVETEPRAVRRHAGHGACARYGSGTGAGGRGMRFALVNPNWDFTGSTYFGCQEPHYPLELLFSFDKIRAAGHEPLLVD